MEPDDDDFLVALSGEKDCPGSELFCSFDLSSHNGCLPLTVSFVATPSGGVPPYTFNWSFSGALPSNSTTQSGAVTYSFEGFFPVTASCTDSCGTTINSGEMTVHAEQC